MRIKYGRSTLVRFIDWLSSRFCWQPGGLGRVLGAVFSVFVRVVIRGFLGAAFCKCFWLLLDSL